MWPGLTDERIGTAGVNWVGSIWGASALRRAPCIEVMSSVKPAAGRVLFLKYAAASRAVNSMRRSFTTGSLVAPRALPSMPGFGPKLNQIAATRPT